MNKKVLLVEDDLQMQSLIVDYLKDYGFIVTAFDNPKDVLEDFKLNSDYSIIILDLMLPFMDGFDLFNKLKEIKNIPIISQLQEVILETKYMALSLELMII